MNKLNLILLVTSGIILSTCIIESDRASSSDDFKRKSRWIKQHLTSNDPQLPFSFQYDGEVSSLLLEKWKRKVETMESGTNRIQNINTWKDPGTGLEVRCVSVEYTQHSVVEWTVYFRNTGTENTPVLTDIQGLDTWLRRGREGEFILHGNKGDWNSADSYAPYREMLGPGITRRFKPDGGRSTNGTEGWPYYNIQIPGGGAILAVGWPGQWVSSFMRDEKDRLHVRAGQELTNLYLKPGEEIRTPLIVLYFWKGNDVVQAQNLWRRWMLRYNLPRTVNNEPPVPMYIFCSGGFFPGLKVSESSEKQFIDSLTRQNIKIDYWWMDAGWYPCGDRWSKTGTWEIDTTRFPDGIRTISDYAHERGMKLILWFEPERVGDKESWLAQNHPEWLLGGKLLNLGNPETLKWLTGHVDKLITEQGIDLYRQDFNMDPLTYWRSNDSIDRQGITENLHIQGYLSFWDELKRRHPGMLIDACASGGRRNDLETMRRAVPLLRSDYQSFEGKPEYAAGNQGHTYGISSWLPFYGHGVYKSEQNMPYYVQSHMSPSFGICIDVREPGINWDEYRMLVNQWQSVSDFMLGDYYPLSPYNLHLDQWIAWQFNRPDHGDGMIQAFRRENSAENKMTFKLRGLNHTENYQVTNLESEESVIFTGKDLTDKGLTIEIKSCPGSSLIKYKKLCSDSKL